MLDQNQIDWNAVDQDAQTAAASTNAAQTTKQDSKMLKMKIGFHYLRIIPAGNNLQKKFYLHLVQHPMKVPKDDGSGMRDVFVLCWSQVLSDLVKLLDPNTGGSKEKAATQSMVSYLGSVGKINNQEVEKFRTHGCPMCKVFNYLNQMGVDKDLRNKFYPQEQYFFNVIHRSKQPDGYPSFGDDNVYVWRQAKKNGGNTVTTINMMKKQANTNYIDINTGKDIMIQATGELLNRRYPIVQFMDMPSPLNLGERMPHNLLDFLSESHYDYQKVVNFMKASYGKVLQDHGYIIPGDQAILNAYPSQVSEAVHAAQQMTALHNHPSQFAGQQVQLPHQPMYNDGDGVEYVNGVLVNKRTGQPMF